MVIGANDSSNALGTALGAKIMKYEKLILFFSIFVMLGTLNAFNVGHTMNSIVSGNILYSYIIAGIIIGIITYKKIPISTHQVIVCSLVGLNIHSANLGLFLKIVGSWIISPILSGIVAYTFYKMFSLLNISIIKRVSFIKYGVILSGGLIAYNLGANDLPTVIGAISTDIKIYILGGLFLIIGAYLFGKGVAETVGSKLIKLNPSGAFISQLSAGLSVLLFTQFGMPVSTTQSIIGGIVGVGLTKGIKTVNWKTLRNIVLGWVLAPSLSIVIGYILSISGLL